MNGIWYAVCGAAAAALDACPPPVATNGQAPTITPAATAAHHLRARMQTLHFCLGGSHPPRCAVVTLITTRNSRHRSKQRVQHPACLVTNYIVVMLMTADATADRKSTRMNSS